VGARALDVTHDSNFQPARVCALSAQQQPDPASLCVLHRNPSIAARSTSCLPISKPICTAMWISRVIRTHRGSLRAAHLGLRRIRRAAYLRLKGDFGTGKTRTLMALGSIVYKGFLHQVRHGIADLPHVDRFGGTLILDEADLRFSDKTADLVKILNNGRARPTVLRTLQNAQNAFNPAAFTVSDRRSSLRAGLSRTNALESRFLTENMALGRCAMTFHPIARALGEDASACATACFISG